MPTVNSTPTVTRYCPACGGTHLAGARGPVKCTSGPRQPATTIARSEDRTFRGPTTVNEFSASGFKAGDRAR